MRQNISLQLCGAAQCVTINLQHLIDGNGLCRRIEVTDIGEQKAQCVANPAVGINYPGQNFVVNAQVARVVGRGAPQANNLSA